MTPELDNKLCEKYPKIFADRRADPSKTCMYWGFEHGDGWYAIIDELCQKIQDHCDKHDFQTVAMQVKEKFGTLRFYVSNADDVVYDFIEEAERQSEKTCEICGTPGSMNSGPWLRTLCDKHKENQNAD